MQDHTWVRDIRSALGLNGLVEYLQLWDTISSISLNTTQDVHLWKSEASGVFSTKSAYKNFLLAPSLSSHGSDFGSPGPLVNTNPLCG
jgi:hypothetical protein